MPADERLLAEVQLFARLDEEERRALAESLDHEKVPAGKQVFAYGDPGECLYIVRSGQVEIFLKEPTGEKIVLKTIGPGELFGELAVFDEGPRSAYAVALEESEMLVLDRATLERFVQQRPHAALDLLAVMAQRVRATNEVVRGRTAKNPNVEIQEELSWQLRAASFIAQFSGSMAFLYLNATYFTVWIVINLGLVPGVRPFDPFPFGLLTMSVSLEAIFLTIFVLLAQNLQSAKDKIRGDIEYEVNLRAEVEVAQLHEKLDQVNARILERLHRLENSLRSTHVPPHR